MSADRVVRQLEFLLELDKAKSVYRRSYVTAESRHENDGEHMWHLAMCVLVLAEHASEPIDVMRTLQLVLVHDIVEIDAGDVFIYASDAARAAKDEAERRAADRIYGLLPPDQAAEFRALWDEFEARETPESRFAAAVDRLQPLLLNHATGGKTWRENGVTADRVLHVNRAIGDAAPRLWEAAQRLISDAVERGYLADRAEVSPD